jgi:hypothetical protein
MANLLLSPDHPMRTGEALFFVAGWSEQAERLDRKKHFSYKNKRGINHDWLTPLISMVVIVV